MAVTLPICAGVFVSIIERVPATSHHRVRVVIHFVYIWLCVCRRPSLLLLRFLTWPPRLTFPVKNRCRIFSFSRRSFTSFRLSVVSSPANGTRRCIDCSLYTRNRTIVVPFPQSRRLLSESFLPVLRIADISKREYAVYDCTHEFPCTRTFQHVIIYCVVCKWPKRARRRRRPLDDLAASRDATFFPRTSPRLVLFHSDVSARPKFRVSTVSASLHRFIKRSRTHSPTFVIPALYDSYFVSTRRRTRRQLRGETDQRVARVRLCFPSNSPMRSRIYAYLIVSLASRNVATRRALLSFTARGFQCFSRPRRPQMAIDP